MIIALKIIIVIGTLLVLLALYSTIRINYKRDKELDKLTLQDCIDTYLEDDKCPVINDGKVIGFQFNK